MKFHPKVKSFTFLVHLVRELQHKGQTVGLITGCFDILHIGHIQLFRLAKSKCDVVIVGLDNDQTIRISKGSGRPIHNWQVRSSVLSEMASIDYVFKIRRVIDFGTREANNHYLQIITALKPDFLITNRIADKFWRDKKKRAESIGAGLILDMTRRRSSTTGIIERLRS